MSAHESALFVSEDQRERILQTMVSAYYFSPNAENIVIFDTNRAWCTLLPAIVRLFPDSRVICCLRNPSWILDSMERLVQHNALMSPRIFSPDMVTVYNRVESLMKTGFVGASLNALRQAWFGEHAGRLIGIRYDSLADSPKDVIDSLYDELGEERFVHDFGNVSYEAVEFDARLGMPGLHRVRSTVKADKRATVLPPDVFAEYDSKFWERNPRKVLIL